MVTHCNRRVSNRWQCTISLTKCSFQYFEQGIDFLWVGWYSQPIRPIQWLDLTWLLEAHVVRIHYWMNGSDIYLPCWIVLPSISVSIRHFPQFICVVKEEESFSRHLPWLNVTHKHTHTHKYKHTNNLLFCFPFFLTLSLSLSLSFFYLSLTISVPLLGKNWRHIWRVFHQ